MAHLEYKHLNILKTHNMNETIILAEVKISTLKPVMKTNDNNFLYRDSKGRYFATDKEAIKAALLEDLESDDINVRDCVSTILFDIVLIGGWDKVKEVTA